MKGKKFLLTLILISLSFIFAKELNYDEFKEKSFPKKIKYIVVSFFSFIEQYTIYFLLGLNVRQISEPYDFFFCFIAGCCIRILFLILQNIYKSMFKTEDNYVYNEPDNTENLYMVIKKLDEFSENLNDFTNKKEEKNNNNIINNDDEEPSEYKEIEEMNKKINDKLKTMEKCINLIENNYKDEKNNNINILKTIKDCQQYIIKQLEDKEEN